MKVECVWEHNGNDTLLYAANFPGAYTRGIDLETAVRKMPAEIRSYLAWMGCAAPDDLTIEIVQDAACSLKICDADSDVLFDSEREPLTIDEYTKLKQLALKSAEVTLMAEGIEAGVDADVRVALRDSTTGIFSVNSAHI